MSIYLNIEEAFLQAEHCFQEVSTALVSGAPEALLTSSAKLQHAAFELSYLLKQAPQNHPHTHVYKSRLKALTTSLGDRKESLVRRKVLVDRALNALVPSTVKSTYGQSPNAYGAVGRQTGAFKTLSA